MRKIYGKYHRICPFFPPFQNPLYCTFIELTHRWIFPKFIINIGRTLSGITKNPKSTSFIFQAILMAVQQDNVQCVQGAYGESAFEEVDEIFYIVKSNIIF